MEENAILINQENKQEEKKASNSCSEILNEPNPNTPSPTKHTSKEYKIITNQEDEIGEETQEQKMSQNNTGKSPKQSIPHFMQDTKASKQHTEKENVLRSPKKMKEVDTTNLPRYMQHTKASRTHYEKEEPSSIEKSRNVKSKGIDSSSIPHFMKTTAAYEKSIEKEETKKEANNGKTAKPVSNTIPRYMQPTQSFLKKIEKEEEEESKVKPTKIVKEKKDGLPRFMQATAATNAMVKGKEEEMLAKKEEKKRKQEQEQEFLSMKAKWELQREEVNKRINKV